MAIRSIPVDQRVIDIDSRRFASIEKALVELITNSDESYARLVQAGSVITGSMHSVSLKACLIGLTTPAGLTACRL